MMPERTKQSLYILSILLLSVSIVIPSNAAELHPLDPAKTQEAKPRSISGSSAGLAPIEEVEPDSLEKSSHLDLEGPFSFSFGNGLAEMSVGAVVNHRSSGSISGTLELRLFASVNPPNRGQTTFGYELASWRPSTWHGNNGNQLKGGYRVSNVNPQNLTYDRPAPGCYYVSIFLVEWNGAEFVSRDFWTYTAETFGLGGGSCAGPPAAPSGLTAIPTSSSTIDLFWTDNSDNEDEFRVQISREGGAFQDLGSSSANSTGGSVSGLLPDTTYSFRVRAYSSTDGFSNFSSIATATTFADGRCNPNATTLCLSNDRYAVRASYVDSSGNTGQGIGIEMTEDTGYFWFFSDTNVETVIKVIDACNLNDQIWVFAGGLTDLGITLTVEDTANGNAWTGINPLGRPFETITDAFALPCD